MTDYVLYEHKNNPAIRYYVHPEDDLRMSQILGGHPHEWGEVRIRCPRNAAFDAEDAPEYRMAVGGVMPALTFRGLYRPVREGEG